MLKSNSKRCDEMSTTKNFFRASAEDFKKIPGSPVAYWASEKLIKAFESKCLGEIASPRQGLATGCNDVFVKDWSEVSYADIHLNAVDRFDAKCCGRKWFPYNKGGEFRKWYGNQSCVVNWLNDGFAIRSFVDEKGKLRSRPQNMDTYFLPSVSWSKISSGSPAFRFFPVGFVYDVAGTSIFTPDDIRYYTLGFCNSCVTLGILNILSPTLNFEVGHIASLPMNVSINIQHTIENNVTTLISLSRCDWDEYETSWDFKVNPLVCEARKANGEMTLADAWKGVFERRMEWAARMKELEEENNKLFIGAYGLQDELSPEVKWKDVSITGNPFYRYKVDGESLENHPELELRARTDTIKELISYAIGCMMGRYSLEKEGLVIASQGEMVSDKWVVGSCGKMMLKERLSNHFSLTTNHFPPDVDGIIPVLEDDCFADDIVTQFHKFLRTAFGERHFNENLTFVESALGRDVRSYFVKDFYNDHLQRYQKRPIYWLYSSPKGTFSALVYMHRHNAGTAGQVLAYLRSHITKIQSRIEAADGTLSDSDTTLAMKTRAIKERGKLARQLKELEDYERDVLHPVASKRIEIDLDDGVRKNYPMFGAALRKIPGMGKEES